MSRETWSARVCPFDWSTTTNSSSDPWRLWTDPTAASGSWVISGRQLRGIFAKYAVRESSDGHRYYDDKSGHKWTQFEGGSTTKTGLEISLCQDPRRDDCRIE